MASLVRLSYLLDFYNHHIGIVYQQLNFGSEFREAIGAEKIQGVWFVDADLVPSFDPTPWNMYGERRETIDLSRYVRVAYMDESDERTRRVRDLIYKSKAMKSALETTTFSHSRSLDFEAKLLTDFDPDEWLYCHERQDWAKDSDLHMVPLVRAAIHLPNKMEVLRKFRLNPLVRGALGAKRYSGDRNWWIDRNPPIRVRRPLVALAWRETRSNLGDGTYRSNPMNIRPRASLVSGSLMRRNCERTSLSMKRRPIDESYRQGTNTEDKTAIDPLSAWVQVEVTEL